MSTETWDHAKDAEFAAYVDRILELRAQVDAKEAAVRAVYAEVKSAGYCKTSVGKIIHYLRLPSDERLSLEAEQGEEVTLLMRNFACLPSEHSFISEIGRRKVVKEYAS